MGDRQRLLHEFQTNPFYAHFIFQLQKKADNVMAQVACGQFPTNDVLGILRREQEIGNAGGWLGFQLLVDQEREKQTEEQQAQEQ